MQVLVDGSISVLFCVLIVALLPIQFGFTDSSFLFMGRFLGGFGVEITSYAVPVYIAREVALDLLTGSHITIGILLVYLFGLSVNWKTLAVLGQDGVTEEFETSLQVLRGFDMDIVLEANEIKISSLSMTISLILVSVAFYLKGIVPENSHLYSNLGILSVVDLVTMAIGFSLGPGPIPWVILPEGLAGSTVATLANWLSSFLITMTENLFLSWSSGGTFTVYALVSAFTVAFAAIWVPETQGRTLEEIQSSFR